MGAILYMAIIPYPCNNMQQNYSGKIKHSKMNHQKLPKLCNTTSIDCADDFTQINKI